MQGRLGKSYIFIKPKASKKRNGKDNTQGGNMRRKTKLAAEKVDINEIMSNNKIVKDEV